MLLFTSRFGKMDKDFFGIWIAPEMWRWLGSVWISSYEHFFPHPQSIISMFRSFFCRAIEPLHFLALSEGTLLGVHPSRKRRKPLNLCPPMLVGRSPFPKRGDFVGFCQPKFITNELLSEVSHRSSKKNQNLQKSL